MSISTMHLPGQTMTSIPQNASILPAQQLTLSNGEVEEEEKHTEKGKFIVRDDNQKELWKCIVRHAWKGKAVDNSGGTSPVGSKRTYLKIS